MILERRCCKCGKSFKCNFGCKNEHLKKMNRCHCPECASKHRNDYPKLIREVCSRFMDDWELTLPEKVVFT